MKVTIFKSLYDSKNPSYYDLSFVLNRIKSGNSKESVLKFRETKDDKHKTGLPSICFAGTFSQRNKQSCIESSGLACIDFDNLDNVNDFKEQLKKDKFVYVSFVSPSGNGLKVLVKIPEDIDQYEQYYKALLQHFDSRADQSTKDISRVCFESYDPDIYINENSEVWATVIETTYNDFESVPDLVLTDEGKVIANLRKWLDNNFPISAGNRSNNLFKFASACNDYGVNKSFCEYYCISNFQQQDFTANEIRSVINSAYRNASAHGSKFFNDTDTITTTKKLVRLKKDDTEIKEILVSSGIDARIAEKAIDVAKDQCKGNLMRFWSESVNKSGKKTIELERVLFLKFLNQQGFYRYSVGNSYVFIKVYNNIVKQVELHDIKSFVFDYVEKNFGVEIIEFLARGVKTYFSKDLIELIDFYEYYQHNSTRDTSYFYFKNHVIKLTKNDIQYIDYIDLNGFVWESHIIQRDFVKKDKSEGDFLRFLINVSGGNGGRFEAFCSAIGFLLHDHKDTAHSPCIILNDEKISDSPEGGTGKGLFMKAISNFKRSVSVDGKGFKFDKSFIWQRVDFETQLIVLEDVNKGFDFEKLFSLITEGLTVEKKGLQEFYIPFNRSPKVCITTNYAIKGSGNSFARRKFEIEFAQFYNKNFSPYHEFKRTMFDDWDQEEWEKFDFFMLSCVQFYLENGLVEYEHVNLEYKKLVTETCQEFVDFMDDFYSLNMKFILIDCKNNFLSQYPDRSKYTTSTSFNKYLSIYAESMSVEFVKTKSGGFQYGEFKRLSN